MAKYKIYPLKLGEFLKHEKSTLLYLQGFGEKMVTPIIAYRIVGEGRKVLVDTGGSGAEWAAKHHHPIARTEDMKILNGLQKHGLDPSDLTCLVNTHLHWDHCWNNDQFPGKDIYLQRRELEFALNPLPTQYLYYEAEAIGMRPPFKKTMAQYKLIDGDFNLFPGIDLVFLPSHTPGFQGVLVDTEKGRYLIAGDCLGIFKNWEGDNAHKHIPSSIHVSLYECYDTYAKIERICDYILPGHDGRVFECGEYG